MTTNNSKKSYRREAIIGLCVLISIAILVVGINFLKGVNLFKASNYYNATYTNVAGLSQSAPVTLNGYKIGLVREITYDYAHPGHINVEMSVSKSLRIPEGSVAVLVTDLLGTASIELRLSNSTGYHHIGDTLKTVNDSGLLDKLSSEVMPSISDIMPKIDSIITALANIASSKEIQRSVENIDAILAELHTTSITLNKTMARLPKIADNTDATMANVRTLSESANTMVSDLAAITTQIKEARIDSTLTNIHSISNSLAEVCQKLNSDDSTVGRLLNDPALYESLNASVASLDSLLQDVKRNPKRYISIKLL